jgi:hypothetical protein
VTGDRDRPAPASDAGDPRQSRDAPSLESLRDILFGQYRQQIAELEAELDDLERRVSDEDALIAMIAPVLGDAIRRKIRDARDEMIEALYPIIGQTVVRAVSEAMRDLARAVDAQMRRSFSPRAAWRRLQARLRGVSGAEMALREALPFEVAEIFLIHRETGLLLRHLGRDPGAAPDSDLVSGMLTAIRDFVQDAFGRGEEGQLDEIQYGERRILIEASQHAYLAVVVDGVEPPGFRAEMRERIVEVEHTCEKVLRRYEGDPAALAPVEGTLRSLMRSAGPPGLSRTQKRVLAAASGLAVVCLAVTCLAGGWAWRTLRVTPTPVVVAIAPAPTFTATPTPAPTLTPIPSPTSTALPSPTPTSIPTATPTPAPVIGLMTGDVWLHEGPSADSPRLGMILERGQTVEILALFSEWVQVRWTSPAQAEVTGWVSLQWVGTTAPIPAQIVTPTPSS